MIDTLHVIAVSGSVTQSFSILVSHAAETLHTVVTATQQQIATVTAVVSKASHETVRVITGAALAAHKLPALAVWGALGIISATAVSALIGIIWPGPITGVLLPISLTTWWAAYRLYYKKT